MATIANVDTRLLRKEEAIPYDLLLLADEEVQAIEKYIHQSDIYVFEQIDKIVGVYVLYPIDEHTAEIKAIALNESFQNLGIGKCMLKDAAIKATAKGFKELVIGTPSVAQKQLAIYQKAGFEQYDIKKDFFITNYSELIFEDGVQLTDMVMLRKDLK
jgi:N-acetylglutamate synthase-like GNAT family acetyltransferase